MTHVLINPEDEEIIPGSTVELLVYFTAENASGGEEPIEPAGVTLELQPPNEGGALGPTPPRESMTPSKVSKGIWKWVGEPEAWGRWFFYWDGDGVAPVQGSFPIAQRLA